VLHERERELAELDDLVEAARAGAGRIAVIEGPPGIGKTTLLGEIKARAAARDMLVLSGRGGELEQDFPFGVVRQLFEGALLRAGADERELLLGGAARPAMQALGIDVDDLPPEDGFRVMHGLYWLCANLAATSPLLLCVDDAQWADPATGRWLGYIARRIEELPVLLLVGTRPVNDPEGLGPVSALIAEPQSLVVRPRLLSATASTAIVRNQLDAYAPEAFVTACHRATGGNPFLLGELLAACRQDGTPATVEGAAAVEGLGPQSIGRSVLLRLGRLGPDSRALASAVAILGTDVPLPLAAGLAGLDAAAASRAADALADAGVLAPSRPLEFVHPVIRNAVYSEMGEAERSVAHRAAVDLLEAQRSPHDALAPHLMAIEPSGSASLVDGLRAAARAAMGRGAADGAVRFLQRALAEPPPPEVLDDVLVEFGSACAVSGHHREAIESLTAVMGRVDDPRRKGELALVVVPAMAYAGQAVAADALCDELAAELIDADRETALKLYAHEGFSRNDNEEAERLAPYRTLAGDTLGERLVLSRVAHNVALRLDGTVDEVLALAQRALPGPEWIQFSTPLEGTCTFEVLWALLLCDHLDITEPRHAAMAAAMRAGGYEYPFVFERSWAAEQAYRTGALADAADAARTGLAIASRLPVGVVPPHRAKGYLVQSLLEQGEIGEARRVWDDVEPGPNFTALYGDLRHHEGELRIAEGDLAGGIELLLAFGQTCDDAGRLNPSYYPWRARAGVALAALDRGDEAMALVTEGAERARRFAAPAPLGILLRAQGLIQGGDAGIEALRQSVELLATSVARHEHARAVVDLGAALRRANHRADAREWLRQGAALADAIGATPIGDRARQELSASGARPRRAAISGPQALTASERRVAELAGRGAANREIAQQLFVSLRTVEMHLTSVYRKLGIGSRAELTPELVPSDLLDGSPTELEQQASAWAAADGTVSVLFTDIEGSSRLVDSLGDHRWLELLHQHNRLIRGHVAAQGGHEVKTIGDGFMVAFPSARRALHCAVNIQRDLATFNERVDHEPIRVRAGLHVGEAIAEDGDFHGRTVVMAARIAGAARGGEILVSELVRELVGGTEFAFGAARPAELKGLAGSHALSPVIW
jgi:class 3 adenylate cyclase